MAVTAQTIPKFVRVRGAVHSQTATDNAD